MLLKTTGYKIRGYRGRAQAGDPAVVVLDCRRDFDSQWREQWEQAGLTSDERQKALDYYKKNAPAIAARASYNMMAQLVHLAHDICDHIELYPAAPPNGETDPARERLCRAHHRAIKRLLVSLYRRGWVPYSPPREWSNWETGVSAARIIEPLHKPRRGARCSSETKHKRRTTKAQREAAARSVEVDRALADLLLENRRLAEQAGKSTRLRSD